MHAVFLDLHLSSHENAIDISKCFVVFVVAAFSVSTKGAKEEWKDTKPVVTIVKLQVSFSCQGATFDMGMI